MKVLEWQCQKAKFEPLCDQRNIPSDNLSVPDFKFINILPKKSIFICFQPKIMCPI